MLDTGRERCQASSLEFRSCLSDTNAGKAAGPIDWLPRIVIEETEFFSDRVSEAKLRSTKANDLANAGSRACRSWLRGARTLTREDNTEARNVMCVSVGIGTPRPSVRRRTAVRVGPKPTNSVKVATTRRKSSPAHETVEKIEPNRGGRATMGAKGKGVDAARAGQLACPGFVHVRARSVAPNRSEAPDDA